MKFFLLGLLLGFVLYPILSALLGRATDWLTRR